MKMEHYLSHTDYLIWQVIQNRNGPVYVITDTNGMIKVLPPKTAEEVMARERERKARTTLLMALPEDHLEKFHMMADANEILILRIQLVLVRPKWNVSIVIKWAILLETAELKGTKTPEEEMLGSDNEVQYCSKTCAESYAWHKKLYDEQRDKLSDASVEITAYKAQLLCHQKNQLAYEQKIRFMKIDLDNNTDVLAYHKKLLAKALKEKEDLKTKFENWQNSLKNLNRMLNKQMSANDKFGLGYGDYRYGSILSYENEVLQSVFMNKESDLENTSVNDRYAARMHVTLVDESDSKTSEYTCCESDSSLETPTSMPAPVENAPKVICEPKVWTDAPIIKEYESDSDDDSLSNVQKDKDKPSFAFIESAKHVKTSRENVKETGTPNHCPKIKKQDRYGHARKGLGYTRKACFVCVNDARQKFSRQAASTSTASIVNTGRPVVNETRPKRMLLREIEILLLRPQKVVIREETEILETKSSTTKDDPHKALKDKGIVDSGCFRHVIGNKAHLADYQEFKGGSVAFGGSNGRITGKRKIKAGKLDFEDVYYVEELKHYNLFTVSQMCDKKNKVLFIDTDCLVVSSNFKLLDENQILFKIPKQHNMYSFNLKNIDPSRDLSCLFAKALIDKSNKWHKRLGHVNFKNLNKLVMGNLVRGLPSNIFKNDHTCVAFQKEKQNKASCKAKTDETTPILKDFIRQAENQFNHKVKTIRSDNETEFKNNDLIELCGLKGIKREYSNARTPQQNRVAERKNRTLIEAARTMVLVTKPQNKTPYELLTGKFDGKSDSGFLVRYSLNSKAFRVYNLETKRVEENLHVNFLENNPNVAGKRNTWMFDLDYLTNSMNYEPVLLENQANKSAGPKEANHNAGTKANNDQGANSEEIDLHDEHFVLPIWSAYLTYEELKKLKRHEKEANDAARKEATHENQNANTNSTNLLNDDKYVAKILKKIDFLSVKTASTPIETHKPLVKDEEAADMDVHLYRSMIGSLMYLTAFRPDIMFAVCGCSRFQVTPKTSHLQAVKRIFRKSTAEGCQFLGRRLISWQHKKQTIVATSTTEVEYVGVAHCCGQVL
uniref:Integrase catalytic domain-containing protein n=1 Tax=Tanacetum cinerariifolium TaxID=118510 RepID=A0A6L2JT70_TANCI|nr:hypothetical protein [Tanacetum cinerariifolium]